MNKQLTIEEKINNLEHNQQIIIESLEQIKKHLWHDDEGEHGLKEPLENGNNSWAGDSVDYEEEQAVNYIQNVLIPDLAKKEEQKGEMVAQSAWIEWVAKPFIEFLKTQTLIWTGKALEELKNQLLPVAIEIADYVLEQAENFILKQHENSDEKQKAIFKEKIAKKFPNSRLLGKL